MQGLHAFSGVFAHVPSGVVKRSRLESAPCCCLRLEFHAPRLHAWMVSNPPVSSALLPSITLVGCPSAFPRAPPGPQEESPNTSSASHLRGVWVSLGASQGFGFSGTCALLLPARTPAGCVLKAPAFLLQVSSCMCWHAHATLTPPGNTPCSFDGILYILVSTGSPLVHLPKHVRPSSVWSRLTECLLRLTLSFCTGSVSCVLVSQAPRAGSAPDFRREHRDLQGGDDPGRAPVLKLTFIEDNVLTYIDYVSGRRRGRGGLRGWCS